MAVIRCLVNELGADVNQATQDGSTAVHITSTKGNLAVVRCLVKDFGADVNQAKLDGATPLIIAARYAQENVVAVLIKYSAKTQTSALHCSLLRNGS